MQLDIVTPEKNIFSDEITSLTAPTTTGEITILPGHINLLTQLVPGELVIKTEKATKYIGVAGGFLEMNDNKISILAEFAVPSEHIAVEKALEAQKRAEELKRKMSENISQEDQASAAGELRRALMEQHIAIRRRHRERMLPNS